MLLLHVYIITILYVYIYIYIYTHTHTPGQTYMTSLINEEKDSIFSSSGKFKLQFFCSWQKAADYVKKLNDLSLAQEGCLLCGEEWIFQQDNAAIHNASVIKKYLLEQIKTSWPPRMLSRPIENCGDWLLQKFMKVVDSTLQFQNSKTQSKMHGEKIPLV